jgi:hypothetical protein
MGPGDLGHRAPGANRARATTAGESALNGFQDIFGDLSAGTALAEGDLRRIVTRAHYKAARGNQPPGYHRDRAAERDAIARQIAEALQARDAVSAASLIEEAAGLGFDHNSMLAAVERLAREDRTREMDAARRDVVESSPDAADRDDWWLDEPYEEEE